MELWIEIGRYASAAGFFILGAMALREWMRHGGPHRGYLAGALGLLAIASVVGRINDATGYRYHLFSDLGVIGFLGSGYFLVLFRHAFLPLGRRVRGIILAGVIAVGTFTIAIQLPNGQQPKLTSAEYAAVVVLFIAWGLCVGEPAFRFWREARHLPRAQRSRLRALATGYGVILVILTFALSTGSNGVSPARQLAMQALVIATIPVLRASFAPPDWLRTLWRSHGEESLRTAMDELIAFSADAQSLTSRALDAGLEVVGSDTGFVMLPSSEIVAARGVSIEGAEGIATRVPPADSARIEMLDAESSSYAIVIPLKTNDGLGSFTVLSSSFTPLFGDDEIRTLEQFVASIALALERIELMGRVEDQRQLYESLLTAEGDLGEGVAIFDVSTSKFAWVNSAAADIYGYTEEELLRLESGRVLVAPEWLEKMVEMGDRWRSGEEIPDRYEVLGVKKDGSRVHIEAASKKLDGTRTISVFRDISDRKKAEHALKDAYERERAAAQSLRELDQMKNTFLSAVSHDLRTPLTIVLGLAKTLEVHGAHLPQEEAHELVLRICKGAERLQHMLMNLLDIDRLARGILDAKRMPTRMDTLVEQTVRSLELPMHRIELDCDSVTFSVDPGQVERIVENLVINAVRHTSPDAQITIRLVNLVTAVSIEVQDDGPGIADHLKEVIFEPFRQGDGPHVGGTGIGLALVAEFAQLHGGTAWVEDAPGGGALFKVQLEEHVEGRKRARPIRATGGAGQARLRRRSDTTETAEGHSAPQP